MIAVVTGGAGFIGSHLVDALVARGNTVVVIDSLASGTLGNIARHRDKVRFVKADLRFPGWEGALSGADRVYHLAADPDVRQGAVEPGSQFEHNVVATGRLLEAMREHGIREIAFTSTSTVYGEAGVIPTPEEYTPLEPISVYGGCKLAAEALISAYCHSFGMRAWVYRFANIIGPRSGHGVIHDFIGKLRKDPATLEILGDGWQAKSYLDVGECIRAMLFVADHADGRVNTYNIGSEDQMTVREIAECVCKGMGLHNVTFRYTGGDRGWVGDVPRMQLAIGRLKALGWVPRTGSAEAVRSAVRAMLG